MLLLTACSMDILLLKSGKMTLIYFLKEWPLRTKEGRGETRDDASDTEGLPGLGKYSILPGAPCNKPSLKKQRPAFNLDIISSSYVSCVVHLLLVKN